MFNEWTRQELLHEIVKKYKQDPSSVYNTWFIGSEECLKAFRAIRRGVLQVIEDIKTEKFGNDFKSSSLEAVLTAITEQKQVFEGAAHPFYWKPKCGFRIFMKTNLTRRLLVNF